MSEKYNPQDIEKKWQEKWEDDQLYRAKVDWSKPKHYALTMLPYPSGDLHMGHWFAMTPSDARARFMRMQGYNVLFPIGFDAFGLPAENAAVQRNIHPWKWTYANIKTMRKQLRSMGAMFDWEREAVSCDPKYYRWTEWFFKKFYEGDLAYKGEAMVNWSPTLQTVLANEQVIDGKDERTGQPVIQKMMSQWFFRITNYADELLSYKGMDWPEPIKLMQTNWIGRSEGAQVVFKADTPDEEPIEIFTTRPDTLWGATFMVLSPEHPLVDKLTTAEQADAIAEYKEMAAKESEIERTAEGREKTGVFTGGYAINPVNEEKIPVWIADYVLMSYGTGAIMAVPAHDERDFEFARKFGLKVAPVIQPEGEEPFDGETMEESYVGPGTMVNSGPINGIAVNDAKGRKNPGIAAAIDYVEEIGVGEESVNYRLRDWLIGRQRYWGSPIPVIYKQDGTMEFVPDDQLPVLLPEDVDFDPTGRSPLTYHEPFLHTTDSEGNPARRETDTLDTFMCSSWYMYRYLSPDYDRGPFDPEEAAYWWPIDVYTGGAEHATMHLLYVRFFAKAMRDLGMFEETAAIAKEHGRDPKDMFDEPMIMLRNQGQILGEERTGDIVAVTGEQVGNKIFAEKVEVIEAAEQAPAGTVAGELMRRTENILHIAVDEDEEIIAEVAENAEVIIPAIEGENSVNQLKHHLDIQRMSKSKGNVVNPDELVEQYGADTVRGYIMFAFDWQRGGPWNSAGIAGFTRFLYDVWELATADYTPQGVDESASRDLRRQTHQTIQKVTGDMESFSFNTAVAALMALRNTMKEAVRKGNVSEMAWNEAVDTMLLMLAPVSPHITEELWAKRGNEYSIHQQAWPVADEEVAKDETITLIVQVNGKVRDRIEVAADIGEAEAQAAALASETIQERLDGKEPRKVIVVPGRLVNIVA